MIKKVKPLLSDLSFLEADLQQLGHKPRCKGTLRPLCIPPAQYYSFPRRSLPVLLCPHHLEASA